MGKSKLLRVTTISPSSVSDIWDRLQHLKTLQYVAAPYADFVPAEGTAFLWQKGKVFKFYLKVFRMIPFGVHTIEVVEWDRVALSIYTNEWNDRVAIWNHRILLKELDENTTEYTDEVEIGAGWKTTFVYFWSYLFYRHRQRKWRKLLNVPAEFQAQ